MEDLFKNFLYTGVGLVAMTAEKIQNSVGKLVSEGKLSLEEGKKVVDKLVNDFFCIYRSIDLVTKSFIALKINQMVILTKIISFLPISIKFLYSIT